MLSNPLRSPTFFFNGIAVLCILALTGAFAAQYLFGLEPCTLCIYQRWPFVFAIGLAALGRGRRTNSSFIATISGLLFLTFSGNAALAFYHSGVERKWWDSVLEACTVPNFGTDSGSMLDQIMATPSARCDEIPWADPVFGLSMANYNVAFCGALALACLISIFSLRRS